jgi:6-phosphogluconate dehydrogenase
MQIGMIGLGRMGASMARRLIKGGHECVVHDRNPDAVAALGADGASGAGDLDQLAALLAAPRAVWLMVPSGAPTEETIAALAPHLQAGDIIVDGGNSYFKDSVRRAREVASRGIHYIDVGTSGGVWGAARGYCLMVGGAREAVARIEPVLRTLAPGRGDIPATPGRDGAGTAEQGYLHCGPIGSGHFVKMIHNGIEYGLMQAYAEGFDILANADSAALPPELRFDLDLPDIAELWRRASVVSSWLLDLTSIALAADPELGAFTGVVQDSGEGRWTVQAAIDEAVPADVLTASLYARFRSRQQHTFGEKLLSAMRRQFGGHVEPT